MYSQPGSIIIQNAESPGGAFAAPWLYFRNPREIIEARVLQEVWPALERIRAATEAGRYGAGFIAYEAAPAFDPAFRVHQPVRDMPLLWFGIYDAPEPLEDLPPFGPEGYRLGPWQSMMSPEDYARRIAAIREAIAAGDTYQVNFTYPLTASFEGDPWALFHMLHRAQGGRHSAFVQTGSHAVVSASPELFFTQQGDELLTRPMKGTAERGRWWQEDEACADRLKASPKERAENVMIVDLLRNDLGRVARTGSVEAGPLFEVERYETVLQMVSTIRARTAGDPTATLAALFPCGSITGAPKIRTMEIIKELEVGPRGVYTGTIGWMGPGRRAWFNVAIRTVQIDLTRGQAAFGVGGGVTWDSSPQGEYEECRTKARLLQKPRPEFESLETMRWEPGEGYFLLDRHLARLLESACYFRFSVDAEEVRKRLAGLAGTFGNTPQRVRLLVNERGDVRLEAWPIELASGPDRFSKDFSGHRAKKGDWLKRSGCLSPFFAALFPGTDLAPVPVALAAEPIDSQDPFLFNKTTHRAVYERARRSRPELPEIEDVILWNERGELTESTVANLMVDLGGERWTPPRECGLLAGTMRAELIGRGQLRERIIHKDELGHAQGIWLINSVSGMRPARLVG